MVLRHIAPVEARLAHDRERLVHPRLGDVAEEQRAHALGREPLARERRDLWERRGRVHEREDVLERAGIDGVAVEERGLVQPAEDRRIARPDRGLLPAYVEHVVRAIGRSRPVAGDELLAGLERSGGERVEQLYLALVLDRRGLGGPLERLGRRLEAGRLLGLELGALDLGSLALDALEVCALGFVNHEPFAFEPFIASGCRQRRSYRARFALRRERERRAVIAQAGHARRRREARSHGRDDGADPWRAAVRLGRAPHLGVRRDRQRRRT